MTTEETFENTRKLLDSFKAKNIIPRWVKSRIKQY